MFVSLNNYSCFSFLHAVPTPEELVQAAVENGHGAVALTDRGYLSGGFRFYDACVQAGIQPILGLTLPVEYTTDGAGQRGDLVLLAKNLHGWQSLNRLSSYFLSDPQILQHGYLPFALLAREVEDCICLTGGSQSLLFPAGTSRYSRLQREILTRLSEIFAQQVYIQIGGTPVDNPNTLAAKLDAVKRLNLPLVYAPEVYYLQKDQSAAQKVLSAIRLNKFLHQLQPGEVAPPDSIFPGSRRALAAAGRLPEEYRRSALENTLQIAALCSVELPPGKIYFPELEFANGIPVSEVLRQKTYAGVKQRYPELTSAIQDRLEHELQVIETAGFASLFLIMAEIMAHARQADIPTASRGSASSSLVAYCLGITTPDPMRLNLYFERFLNPARSSPPDIDTDICSVRRDQLIEYVYDRFGRERVAMVATVNRFRRKSALRETARVYGLNSEQIKRLVEKLPSAGWGPPRQDELAETDPYQELSTRFRGEPYDSIFATARQIRGLPHHLSIHPGGVVITPGRITDYTATQLSSKGLVITQYDLEGVSRAGLVKIDLLGIRGLTVLGDMADHIIRTATTPYTKRLEMMDSIPADDENTADLLRQGRSVGCFQIESPGMRATLREIQASNIDDVLVALALYRPGPMTGGLKDAFVRRHLGKEQVTHLHPALAGMLADTHGVILYQEQVLKIAHELGGLSLADADLLRRAISHFNPGAQMDSLREKFIRGVNANHQIDPETARLIWDMMAAFAGYGFPKAHAASYAEIAWRSAWFKAHFPAQFMAAVLANWGGYYPQSRYLMEARHLGLKVSPPDVFFAEREFSARRVNNVMILFMGLNQVRELSRRTQERILKFRPFTSMEDFLERVDPRPKEVVNLVRGGCLTFFGSEPELLIGLNRGQFRTSSPQQMRLFELRPAYPEVEPWSVDEKILAQEEVLGVSVEHHRLELYTEVLGQAGVLSTIEAALKIGESVRVGGLRQPGRRMVSTENEPAVRLFIEDLEGDLEIQLSLALYRRYRPMFHKSIPWIVEGKMQRDQHTGEPVCVAYKVQLIE
jgi:DNA-directed DNA polymerase III PolC